MSLFRRISDQTVTSSGAPLFNGFVYVGEFGQDPKTRPIPIYSDEALSIPLPNPQRTDTLGRPEHDIYVASDYSYIIEDENGVTVEGAKNVRLSDSTVFDSTLSTRVITLSELSENIYEVSEDWESAPPNGVYYFSFTAPSTSNPQVTSSEFDDLLDTSGVAQVTRDVVYSATFNGNNFVLFPFASVVVFNGVDLANGYKDENNATENTIIANRLGVLFADGNIQPIGYGIFNAEAGDGLRLSCVMSEAQEDKHKNISLRFVNQNDESITLNSETTEGVITKVDFDIPNSTNDFTIDFLDAIDSPASGRWEIQIEEADNDNHTGNLFIYQIEVLRA